MGKMETDMAHKEVIRNLWNDRHLADHRRTIRAVLRTLRARRESHRKASKK